MTKQLLRTAFLFVICNLSFVIGKAHWVSIPDSNFGKWLNTNGFNTCLQGNSTVGWQMDTTCNAVIGATQVTVQATILETSPAYNTLIVY